jgi:Flp pilus assembly protein CpaB
MDLVHRFVYEHRRLLAAAFTGLAVLAALGSLTQRPDGAPVVVAARDLPSGTVLAADDLRTARHPERPDHAVTRVDDAIGQRVAGPMRAGEALTDRRVLRPDGLSGYGDDAVLATVTLGGPDALTGVRVGDRVDVVAVDPEGESEAQVVARDIEVVTVPATGAEVDGREVSLGVVTTEEVALRLATASLSARFSVLAASR